MVSTPVSMAESKEMSDANERLYVDSYFRLLKSKEDLPEAARVLRGLIQQINTHCAHLNISDESSKKLKIELLTEYHEIMDRENPSGMLTIIPEYKSDLKTKASDQISESITKDALEQLNFYLDNLDINLPSSKKLFTVNKPVIKTANEQKLNNFRPQKYKFTNMPEKRPANEANNKEQQLNNSRPQKYNFTSTANKRPAKETEDSNPSYPSKRTFNRTYNKPKPTTSSSAPKPQTSGFVSASSMYRNPLKKAVEEEAKQAQNTSPSNSNDSEQHVDESLKHFDKKIVDVIFNEIMDFSPNIKWTDIAGLEFVKTTVQEIVIWPLLRPDIFTGLRAPPRGILLFGPPGTGKTLIGKCIATESNSTFFCISASSLASKWVGESEQLVRALFIVARINQPAVIFIDEIDSLLSQRSDKDQDFTRKLKTEFLVQFDGAKTQSEERILVVGATNRPHELDEAARRRFVKRLYVPLPDPPARRQIVEKLLGAHQHNLTESDLGRICDETKGYSGSDVAHLCKEAAMGPIRSIGPANIKTVSLDQVRAIQLIDFLDALRQVRASVAQDDLNYYLDWNKKFGSFGVETG